MSIRRLDIAIWLGLLALAHALLVARVVDPPVNVAFAVVNAYFLLFGALLAQARRATGRPVALYLAAYVAGYCGLIYLCFIYNPQWQPRFFLYAVPYVTLFRLPLGLTLLAVFIFAMLVGQSWSLQLFVALGAVAVMLHLVRQYRRDWFLVAALGVGALLFAVFLFPVFCLATTDSPQTLMETFGQDGVQRAIATSLLSATAAAAVILVFGVPFAWGLARAQFRGKSLVETLIDVPILIPHSAVGVAYLLLFGEKGAWGTLDLANTFAGLVAVQVFVSAPFLIKTVYGAFDAMGAQYEMTARTLGAPPGAAFVRVALPLGARAILIGFILAWARAVSEVGAVELFAYYPMTAPILIANQVSQRGIDQARPIAVALVLTCLFAFLLLHVARRLATGADRRHEAQAAVLSQSS